MAREPMTKASARPMLPLGEPRPGRVEEAVEQGSGREAGQREAGRALGRSRAGAEPSPGVEQVGPRAGRPPVLDLIEDGHAPLGRDAHQGGGVPREMVDVDQLRPGFIQEAPEVGRQAPVVEGVARQGIALGEVVHHQPHAGAAVHDLQSLAQLALGIGDSGVDGHLPPGRLAQGEAAGVDLGAGMVPRRPAVDEVDHPPGSPQSPRHRAGRRDRSTRRSSAMTRSRAGARGSSARKRAMVGRYSGWRRSRARWPARTRGREVGAEAALARVVDEGGVVEDVDEARLQSPEAEFALLAVAQAEARLVEQAQRVERLPLDVEADARRPWAGAGRSRVDTRSTRAAKPSSVQPAGRALTSAERGREAMVALFENGVTVAIAGSE